MTTSPAELQAIRERDARDFVSTKQYVAEAWPVTCREDRRALLALYDAQEADKLRMSDEVLRLREALDNARAIADEHRDYGEQHEQLGEIVRVCDAALGSQP